MSDMIAGKLSKREALDLVIGAKILACGGGGSEPYMYCWNGRRWDYRRR